MGTLALPSYGQQVDVYHENKLDDVLVIASTGSPVVSLTLVVWDDVSTSDQRRLINLFGEYGFPVTTGTSGFQTVKIDTNQLTGSPRSTGLGANKKYNVTVHVTGPGSPNTFTERTATINGAQTFPQLAASLNAQFSDVTVAMRGSDIRFTTVATGTSAKVEIQKFGTLFNPASDLLGFGGIGRAFVGASSTLEVLQLNRNPANVPFSDTVNLIIRKRRPYQNVPSNIRTEYFDSGAASLGSPATGSWRFIDTDQLTGSPNTRPSWMQP
jgi:hypothetical protein